MAYRTKGEFQQDLFNRLGQSSQGALGIALQKKLQEQKRKQELQDAVRKAGIEAMLTGKATGIDINQLSDPNAQIDWGKLQVTPDIDTLYKKTRLGQLTGEMEKERQVGVMGELEQPSPEDIVGMYGTKPGYSFSGQGQVFSPQGTQVASPEIAGAMREKFAGGITKGELARKFYGMPKEERVSDTIQFRTDAQKAIEAINQGADKKAVLQRLAQVYPDKAKEIQDLQLYIEE